jgi:hypothetical protein
MIETVERRSLLRRLTMIGSVVVLVFWVVGQIFRDQSWILGLMFYIPSPVLVTAPGNFFGSSFVSFAGPVAANSADCIPHVAATRSEISIDLRKSMGESLSEAANRILNSSQN